MTLTIFCTDRRGLPKEAFPSRDAARRALAQKRRFRHRRYPATYHCPGCSAWHLTAGQR